MSYASYLWNVARVLRVQVHPDVGSDAARDALDNSIRVLTTIANALEPHGALPLPNGAAPDLPPVVSGPPENPALYDATRAFIAGAVERIRGEAIASEELAALAGWERRLIEAAIDRALAIETAGKDAEADPKTRIDPARLQAYLRQAAGEPELVVTELSTALGGRSRQTALFKIGGASSLPASLVVQRGLPGMAKGAAFGGVAVEFEIVKAMHAAGMKVPRPLFLETGDDALGGPFVIVERANGRVVEPDYWRANAPKPIILGLAAQMALLHAQPIGGLAGLLPRARPSSGQADLIAEIERFELGWQAKSGGPAIVFSAALRWLRANVGSVVDRESLVHNDMVFHNVLADEDGITAILDWEQAAIGHPAEDLGYCYPVVSQVIPWEAFLAAYQAAGGPPVSQREVDFFALRALVRLMLLVHEGRDAFELGYTNDITVTSAGAFFTQRLMGRLARVMDDIFSRAEA